MHGCVEVYRAGNSQRATRIVEALADVGIQAHVAGQEAHAAAEAAGHWARTPRVFVRTEDAKAATEELMRLQREWQRTDRSDAETDGIVEVICEECCQANQFPITYDGSVQECGHCGAWVDVGSDDGPVEEVPWKH